MATVKDVYEALDTLAPFRLQMEFDNAGFLVGHGAQEVTRILVSLDITEEVVAEAAEKKVQLIVAHHPVIFHPVRSLTDGDPTGRILLALAEGHIAAICAHTNLDVALGGVNDALAKRLELRDTAMFQRMGGDGEDSTYGLGRIGTASGEHTASLPRFAEFVKRALGANGVRYVDAGRPVRRVAVGGGACGDLVAQTAAAGCDTFVTSDVKYNQFLDAKALGLNLVDAGHFPTENVVCPVLAAWLSGRFPGVAVARSECHSEVFSYL